MNRPLVSSNTPFRLEAYLERIDYQGSLEPNIETLRALHIAHATHIPFENLSLFVGEPILLDSEALQQKLIVRRRGGYCLEQNLLFASVLEALGFEVRRLAARVRFRTEKVLPRTHVLLLVSLEHGRYLVDVGFGAEGLFYPVPLEGAEISPQFAWAYRVIREGEQWVLQSQRDNSWEGLYAFTLEPQEIVDYELANYYISTHPQSRFLQHFTAQLPSPEGRHILRDYDLYFDSGTQRTQRTLQTKAEMLEVLKTVFGIHLPNGEQLPEPQTD